MMARKTTFSREDVARAALAVMNERGCRAVTARRVAEALRSSTAPVYSNYASMEQLLAEVRRLVAEQVLDYCRRPWATDSFLSMGLGFVRFAKDHPRLFRAAYLEPLTAGWIEHDIRPDLVRDLDMHPFLGTLSEQHKDELLLQASVYTFGIATMVATGRWADPDLRDAEGWLRSLGGLLVRAVLTKAGRPIPAELEQRLGKFVVPWRHDGAASPKDAQHE